MEIKGSVMAIFMPVFGKGMIIYENDTRTI